MAAAAALAAPAGLEPLAVAGIFLIVTGLSAVGVLVLYLTFRKLFNMTHPRAMSSASLFMAGLIGVDLMRGPRSATPGAATLTMALTACDIALLVVGVVFMARRLKQSQPGQ